uniref:Uncharacterized protein n=1 Tax=Romanomermis culicivorax TaxID=13658 RepID=A0A915HJ91_ROMCU
MIAATIQLMTVVTNLVFKVKNQVASSLMHPMPQNVEIRLSVQSVLIGVILIINNVTFQIVSSFQTGYTLYYGYMMNNYE